MTANSGLSTLKIKKKIVILLDSWSQIKIYTQPSIVSELARVMRTHSKGSTKRKQIVEIHTPY